jgi:hypothetical protein
MATSSIQRPVEKIMDEALVTRFVDAMEDAVKKASDKKIPETESVEAPCGELTGFFQ